MGAAKVLKEYPKGIGVSIVIDSSIGEIQYQDVHEDVTDTIGMMGDEEAQKFLVYSLMASIYAIKRLFGCDRAVKEAQFLLETAEDFKYKEVQELRLLECNK